MDHLAVETPSGYVSLDEAAKRTGRSVRTVQRWIERGRLESIEHPSDRRYRLVSSASLDRLTDKEAAQHARPRESGGWTAADTAAIEEVVQGLHNHLLLLANELDLPIQEEDRALLWSSLGRRLQVLIAAVRGADAPAPDRLHEHLTVVLRVLFTDPVSGEIRVPNEFWRSSILGRHLARATLLIQPARDLVNFNEILDAVDLPRVRVENILRAIGTKRFYDPDDDRWLYPREVIAAVQAWTPEALDASLLERHDPSHSAAGSSPPQPRAAEHRKDMKAIRHAYQERYFSN
jgi:excisionase family DNA binding protein